MKPVFEALIFTSMFVFSDFITDLSRITIQRLHKYLIAFLLVLSFLFAFSPCKLHAFDQNEIYLQVFIEPGDESYCDPKWSIEDKCWHHYHYMCDYYERSKDACFLLPEYSDKDKAKACFSTAMAFCVPPYRVVKFIAIAVGLFSKYGLDVIDKYQEVNRLMLLAEYHGEMFHFYFPMLPPPSDDGEYPDYVRICGQGGYVVEHRHVDEDEYCVQ